MVHLSALAGPTLIAWAEVRHDSPVRHRFRSSCTCRCDVTPQLSAVRRDLDGEPSAAGPLAKVYEQIMRVLLHVRA